MTDTGLTNFTVELTVDADSAVEPTELTEAVELALDDWREQAGDFEPTVELKSYRHRLLRNGKVRYAVCVELSIEADWPTLRASLEEYFNPETGEWVTNDDHVLELEQVRLIERLNLLETG
jgi:hypothetical protein